MNWEVPGDDNTQNFWFKKIDFIYEALAAQLIHIIKHPETQKYHRLGYIYM